MNEEDKRRFSISLHSTKHSLQELHGHFNEQARVIKSALDTISVLENELKEKDQEIALLKSATSNSKAKLTFLVDGSGSMTYYSCIENTLSSVQAIYLNLKSENLHVSASFFGGATGAVPLDLTIPFLGERKKDGLYGGTDLNPTLLTHTVSKKKEHLLIISDGGLYDPADAQKTLKEMLAKNKNLQVDFVLLTEQKGTEMERLHQSIVLAGLKQPSQLVLVDPKLGAPAIKQALTQLITAKAKKAPAPSKKRDAGPKAA